MRNNFCSCVFAVGNPSLQMADCWHVCVDLTCGSFVPNNISIGTFHVTCVICFAPSAIDVIVDAMSPRRPKQAPDRCNRAQYGREIHSSPPDSAVRHPCSDRRTCARPLVHPNSRRQDIHARGRQRQDPGGRSESPRARNVLLFCSICIIVKRICYVSALSKPVM